MSMFRRYSKVLSVLITLSLVLSVCAAFTGESYAASAARPRYIAHRGWSSRAPENTVAAFKLAAGNSGFYGVEFDVWESTAEPATKTVTETVTDEDGTVRTETRTVENDPLLLVMHDENIKRMCGVSKNIRSISRSNLGNYTIKKIKSAGIDCASVNYTYVNKKLVKRFHKAGLKVCAWTLPGKKKARKLARMGVDYITASGKVW